jgi:hypothetical protein
MHGLESPTAEQTAHLEEHGFCVISGVLSGREVAALRQEVLAHVDDVALADRGGAAHVALVEVTMPEARAIALGHSPDGAWWRRIEMSVLSRLRSALDAAIADVRSAAGSKGAHVRLPLSAPSDAVLLNEDRASALFRENYSRAPSHPGPGPEPEL